MPPATLTRFRSQVAATMADEPTPPAVPQPPAGQPAPPNPGPPNREAPRRPFPQGQRQSERRQGPPPEAPRDFFAAKPNKRLLDRGLDEEIEAAMAGFDVASTVKTEAGKGGRPPA